MANLSYTPPRHCPVGVYLPHKLQDCDFVFIRNDAVRRPITPAYIGPYRVLKRADKYFQIQKGIRTDNVSIDRLKPAFLEKTTSRATPQVKEIPERPTAPVPSPPKFTRSGRKVTFPKRLETVRYF